MTTLSPTAARSARRLTANRLPGWAVPVMLVG